MSNEFPQEMQQKVAQYIQETDALLHEQRDTITQLTQKVAGLEQGQKQASEAAVEESAVITAVDHLIQAGFLKKANREASVAAIVKNPATELLSFVDKLASQRIGAASTVPLGRSIPSASKLASGTAPRASDQQFEATFNNLRP